MLRLNRRTWLQLSVLALVTVVSCGAMAINFMKLPATLFGIGEYTVTVDLPQSGGLYRTSVVTLEKWGRSGSRRNRRVIP